MVTRTRLDVTLYLHCLSCGILCGNTRRSFLYITNYYSLHYYIYLLLYYYIYYLLQTPGPSSRSHAEIVGSTPIGGMDVGQFCFVCVLTGRGLCDELITRPEASYRLRCVDVCDLETS